MALLVFPLDLQYMLICVCRKYLEEEESSIEHLEQKLEKTLKMCTVLVDSGKEYVKNQRFAPHKATDMNLNA